MHPARDPGAVQGAPTNRRGPPIRWFRMASFFIRLQRRIYRNRSITFTPAGIRFVLLTLAVGIAAVNTGNNLLYLILGMVLSLIIVSGLLSEQSLRKIIVEWRWPARVFAQQPVPVEMRITNGKRLLPSFSFRVDDGNRDTRSLYISRLSAGETTSSPRTTRFENRGLRTPPPIVLRTTFPFGFFHKSLLRPQTQSILVYPRILPVPPGIRTARSYAGQDLEIRRRGVGADLHNLREYTPGDDARGIHWKASARESKLLLKEFETEADGCVCLTLSPCFPRSPASNKPIGPALNPPDDFERAVEIAAALAWEFSRRSYAVSLQTLSFHGAAADGKTPDPTPSDGTRNLDSILKTLALIQPAPDSTDPALIRKGIAALIRDSVTGGRRILILPFPDPLWDGFRGIFSDVVVASEPRFKQWAKEMPRAAGPRS
jgi:uncharacterized protein (DUF58 family)